MKATDDLFQLIKSLDRTEKRYFKLFSSLHAGDKKYMLLFEAIAKQSRLSGYDEQELLVRFKKERFVNQFWVAKNYLYNLILQSLESYHYSIESALYSQLHRIAILYEKGLYKQCGKVLFKAKLLATKHEKHLILLELLQKEIDLSKAVAYIDRTASDVEAVFQEMFAVEKKISKLNRYNLLASQLSITRKKKGQPRNKEDWKTVEDILKHPLLNEETQDISALPVLAQCYFYTCKSDYYELKEDYLADGQYALRQIKLLEDNFHLTAENPISYINALWNLFMSQLELRRYGEAHLTMDKLNRFSEGCSKNIRQIVFYLAANAELVLYTGTGDISKGVVRANEIIIEYGKMPAEPRDKFRELLLYNNIAHIYFQAGNYALANTYLNKIFNDTAYTNNDIYCFAQIMSLLVYFEMGKQDLLEYKVKSVHHFLYKRERLYKVESIILDFIRKELPKINSAVETQYIASLQKSFELLLIKMKAISNDPFEQRAFDFFDLISWLESKIEGRAFADVVREKSANE